MTKEELIDWLETKEWVEKEGGIYYKDDRRFRLSYDGVRFQKHSPVNGWRTLYFQKYEGLSISHEDKLSGLNVMITNRNMENGTAQVSP